MNVLHGDITPDGDLVDVLIGLSTPAIRALRQAGQPIPQPVAAAALLDQGAANTCLDPAILAPLVALGLMWHRIVLVNAPSAAGGQAAACEYDVGLTVVHPSGDVRANLVLGSQAVLELPLSTLGYQALLGRDVLNRCLLVRDGPGLCFTLAY